MCSVAPVAPAPLLPAAPRRVPSVWLRCSAHFRASSSYVRQPPLLLALLRPVLRLGSEIPMAILFIMLDLAIALLLRKLAEAYQNRQQALRPAGAPFAVSPDLVMILYA